MGHKQYLAVGQSARNRLFGLAPRISDKRTVPLNMMISQQGKINHESSRRLIQTSRDRLERILLRESALLSSVAMLLVFLARCLGIPIWDKYFTLVSRRLAETSRDRLEHISLRESALLSSVAMLLVFLARCLGIPIWDKYFICRLAVIMFSVFTVVVGIILSFVPWLDYIIFRELKLWNGSLSYSYWQKPGVMRLTKVYIFNMTNPQGFIDHGERPKLVEVGPFVYREDMEKVNIKFHDNDTVTYQHNKILRFVPEMSVDKNQKFVVPNIPLLTVTSFSPHMAGWLVNAFVTGLAVAYKNYAKPFVHVTAEELVFGYNDPLVSLAHTFYPKGKRPNSQMGLLLARNGTLDEVSTIHTGQSGMDQFGYIDRINGLDHLPHWKDQPCNNIRASEGSFFPPRASTKSDTVYVYDKDLCRIMPFQYREDVYKDGILTGLYTPPSSTLECADINPDNKCYCQGEKCPPRGLQNISPCQYNAPVYLSYPHFYDADPSLLEPFDGLKPEKEKHESYFKIQPKIGVPLEGFVRVQLNMKVTRAPNIRVNSINNFPDINFPVMWIEEGIPEVSTPIWRWIYLATTVGPVAAPILTYSMILFGFSILFIVFVKAYKNFVIGQNSLEIVELGRETIRRGSTLIIQGSHKLLPPKEAAYHLLKQQSSTSDKELDVIDQPERRHSVDEFRSIMRSDFVKTCFNDAERESLICSDNTFIMSEHERYRFDLDNS